MGSIAVETVGWLGMGAVLIAYLLLTAGVLQSTTLLFQAMNLLGSIALVVVCAYKRTWQPCVLNVIWSIIALGAVVRILTGE
jgi:hypothetical protein